MLTILVAFPLLYSVYNDQPPQNCLVVRKSNKPCNDVVRQAMVSCHDRAIFCENTPRPVHWQQQRGGQKQKHSQEVPPVVCLAGALQARVCLEIAIVGALGGRHVGTAKEPRLGVVDLLSTRPTCAPLAQLVGINWPGNASPYRATCASCTS